MNKKINLGILATTLIFSGFTMASESTGPYLSVGQNWFRFDHKRLIEDDDDLYMSLGYQASSNIAFELKYTDVDVEYVNFSGIYRLNPKSESSFYWKAGLGKYDNDNAGVNSATGNNFNLGAGFEAHMTNAFSFNFGVDGIYQPNGDRTDWVPYFGLSYYFGGSSSKPAKTIQPIAATNKDSDNDGVFDKNDNCNYSPAGAVVDTKGCEIDSDNDGVVDSKDSCLQTPAGAKVKADGCREMLTKDVSIALHVQFANNSNVISEQYRAEIEKVADFMKQYPDTTVVIEGHTDSRGAASYNKRLSQKRADAVAAYLISQFGIKQSRVSAEGKGEISPVTTNDTKDGRAENRRVQAEIKTSVTAAQ